MTTLRPACRDALRSLADGGDTAVQGPAATSARRHVDQCPQCAALVDDDAVADALAALRRRRPSPSALRRTSLAVVAGLQCIIALPWLFGENPFTFLDAAGVHTSHITRDGAIGMIIGVAGLTTALRPRHAFAMLVTVSAAVGMQVLSFAIDEGSERVHPMFETSHVLVPVVLVLVALAALRRDPRVPPRAGPDPSTGRHLHAV